MDGKRSKSAWAKGLPIAKARLNKNIFWRASQRIENGGLILWREANGLGKPLDKYGLGLKCRQNIL